MQRGHDDNLPQDGTGADAGPVLALARDMIFASKIRGTAAAAGTRAETVGTVERLLERAAVERPRLILLDLEAPGVGGAGIRRLLEAPETAGVRLIGFASHVNAEAIREAREAGAHRVVARSRFVAELPALLGGD